MIAVNIQYIIKVQRVFIKRIEIFLHSNSLLSSSAAPVFKAVPKQARVLFYQLSCRSLTLTTASAAL